MCAILLTLTTKIIQRAQQNNETMSQLTDRTIAMMHEDFAAINLLEPDIEPRVTTHIPEIVDGDPKTNR